MVGKARPADCRSRTRRGRRRVDGRVRLWQPQSAPRPVRRPWRLPTSAQAQQPRGDRILVRRPERKPYQGLPVMRQRLRTGDGGRDGAPGRFVEHTPTRRQELPPALPPAGATRTTRQAGGIHSPSRKYTSVSQATARAIWRHDSAQRRQASAHRCIVSSSPKRSQSFAQASHISAHTSHVR